MQRNCLHIQLNRSTLLHSQSTGCQLSPDRLHRPLHNHVLAPEHVRCVCAKMINDVPQAEMMSAKMRNMSDAQMEKLLTTMSWLQSAYSAMQKMRQKMAENRLLCLAVAFLLLALLLQWLGFV